MEDLPEELLKEILLRLPAKCLVSAKCVSKSWLSLISNPSFGQSHFDLALSPTENTLLLSVDDALQIASIDLNAPFETTPNLLTLPIPQPSQIQCPEIIHSCRGFILIECFPDFYVWNPCTSVHRKIPFPPIDADPQCLFLSGFGYDSSTDDYLVTIGCRKDTDRAAIFSLRANTWKQFDDEFFKGRGVYSDPGLFFNGAIHWIVGDSSSWGLYVIVAFDLKERVFFEIALPNGFVNIDDCELRVMGGLLGVCPVIWNDGDDDGDGGDEIWVMEEYKVQSSWRCLVRFSTLHYRSDHSLHCLFPISLTMGGDIVGADYDFKELVKFNYQGEVLERRQYYDCPYPKSSDLDLRVRAVATHTHTLLSLPCEEINNNNTL